jgi:putative transposase
VRGYTSPGHRPGLAKTSTFPGLQARFILLGMSQSLACVLVHVIFSTKDRAPILDASVLPALNGYLATVARSSGCECIRVGGVADHVHLAVRMSRTITIAQLVEELKTSSSKWLKTQSPALTGFAWQGGYGAFSIGPASLETLTRYIDTQEEHHRKRSFQQEYREFLKRYDVAYDERYVWS